MYLYLYLHILNHFLITVCISVFSKLKTGNWEGVEIARMKQYLGQE